MGFAVYISVLSMARKSLCKWTRRARKKNPNQESSSQITQDDSQAALLILGGIQ